MREKKKINVEIGERIKRSREKAGITQECFAEKVGVSTQFVSDLERGVVGASVSTLKQVCVVLSVNSDTLLFGEDRTEIDTNLNRRIIRLPKDKYCLLVRIIDSFLCAVE